MSRKGQEIDAIITFVADDFSHGFVKAISDFSELGMDFLHNRSIPSFRFKPDPETEPAPNQIIRIRIKNNSKDAEVIANTYVGFKRSAFQITPLDSKFHGRKGVVYLSNPKAQSLEEMDSITLIDFFLSFDNNQDKLKAEEIEVASPVSDNYDVALDTLIAYTPYFSRVSNTKISQFIAFLVNSEEHKKFVFAEGKKVLDSLLNDPEINSENGRKTKSKFIKIFGKFGSSVLDVASAKKLYDDDIKLLIEAWLQGVFPNDFIAPLHLITFHNEFDLRLLLRPEDFVPLFSKLNSVEEKERLLEALISNDLNTGEKLFKVLLNLVNDQRLSENLREKLISSVGSNTALKLWRSGEIELSVPQLSAHSSAFTSDDLNIILGRFEGEEVNGLISGMKINSLQLLERILENLIKPVLNDFDYCVFDTEVNPKTEIIDEYAWICNQEEFEELDINEETIKKLQDKLVSSKLVVGHNIENFDYQYVFKEDVKPDFTWDTLKIEALLDPTKKSYALITDHEALADCMNTTKLFLFQLCRLKMLWNKESNIALLLSDVKTVVDKLPMLNVSESVTTAFNKSVFRMGSSVVANKISNSVPKKSKLIVTPRTYWPCFISFNNYMFKDDEEDNLNLVLSKKTVRDKLNEHYFLLSCVERYFENCNAKNYKPYARNLSAYLVSNIQKIVPLDQLCVYQEVESAILVVSPHYYVKHRDKLLAQYKVSEIFFLGTDQWKYESQKLVKILSTEELEQQQEARELWVHFSNGSSLTQLSNEMVSTLHHAMLPEANYWLEKRGLDQYNLMCSIPVIDEITKSEVFKGIDFESIIDKTIPNGNDLLFFKARANGGRKLELNPETLYRDIYWNERLQLIVKLLNTKKQLVNSRIVLAVQKKSEVSVLQRILRELKIYCPSESAAIQRRLELLEGSYKGVLVCDFDDLEQILLCSSNEPVTILLESMRPNELLVYSGRSAQVGLTGTDDSEKNEELDEEDKNSRNEEQELPHMGSAVKKLPSLKDYYD